MEHTKFDVDENLKDLTSHGDTSFSFAAYFQQMELNIGKGVLLHWHEELQFVVMKTGEVMYTVADKDYRLQPGDILFANSKRLHTSRQMGTVPATYYCIEIHPRVIYGYRNHYIDRKYVEPYLKSSDFDSLLIDGTLPWHKIIGDCLGELIELLEKKPFAFELLCQKVFLEIWTILISENRDKTTENEPHLTISDRTRLDKAVDYIQAHYSEKIKLDDIAEAAMCSPEECCRLFKRTIGQSPVTYLTRSRIIKSLSLLTSTEMSISDIAQNVGFGSSSYYTEKFKSVLNCRPLEFRKMSADNQPFFTGAGFGDKYGLKV